MSPHLFVSVWWRDVNGTATRSLTNTVFLSLICRRHHYKDTETKEIAINGLHFNVGTLEVTLVWSYPVFYIYPAELFPLQSSGGGGGIGVDGDVGAILSWSPKSGAAYKVFSTTGVAGRCLSLKPHYKGGGRVVNQTRWRRRRKRRRRITFFIARFLSFTSFPSSLFPFTLPLCRVNISQNGPIGGAVCITQYV